MSLLTLAANPANDNEPLGFVYFMYTETGFMKIGVAKDPEARRRTLQIGCPVTIHLDCRGFHGAWDTARFGLNPYEVEKTLHDWFKDYKANAYGEWFAMPNDREIRYRQKLAWNYLANPYLYEQWYRRQKFSEKSST